MAGAPLPDPKLIPDPAYLVVGAYPSDGPSGRTFWDDPHYYFFDERPAKPDAPPDRVSRYIQGSFHDPITMNLFYNKKKAERGRIHYIEKFDVVIFDYSVVKFLGKYAITILNGFLGSVKKGGKLILIGISPFSIANADTEEKFIKDIETIGLPFRIVSIAESIKENEIAAQVYGPHTYLKLIAASPETRDEPPVVIIDKPGRINRAANAALVAPVVAVGGAGAGAPPVMSAGSNASFSFTEGNTPEQTTSDFTKLNRLFESLPDYMKEDDSIQAIFAEVTSIQADFDENPASIHEYYDRLHQIIESIQSFMANVPRARKSRRRKTTRKTRRQRRRKEYTV